MKLYELYMYDYSCERSELVIANSEDEAISWYDENSEFPREEYANFEIYEIKEISRKKFKIELL